MSLATRCIACGTVFRVVQDQLKVSEGWVRCGRCQEVFNALQNLFDLEREAPPPWPPEPGVTLVDWTSAPQPVEAELNPQGGRFDTARLSTQPLLHTESRDDVADPQFDATPYADRQPAYAPTSHRPSIGLDPSDYTPPYLPSEEPERESAGFDDARFHSDLLDDEPASAAAMALTALQAQSEPAPGFLRQADRAARWRRPRVRAALACVLGVAAVVMAGQMAFQWRSTLAAAWPEAHAVFDPLCGMVGCRIDPPRRLDGLVVENSSLVGLGVPGQSRLTVSLHNRSQTLVLLPSVELTLTDAQGQLVARKALTPTDMGARQTSIAAGAELPLQALLATTDIHDGGYTVEIFYP